jgi:hypothetical protein
LTLAVFFIALAPAVSEASIVCTSYLYWWISVVAIGNWKGKNVEPTGNMNVNGDSGTQILIGY